MEFTDLTGARRDAKRVESAHRRSGTISRGFNQTKTISSAANQGSGPTVM